MRGGFKTVDITPPVGVPLGGNCRDDALSRGVHDRLNADIIVLECGGEKLVLVDIDWVEAPLAILREMKRAIEKESGIPYASICITMTHTHSGPDTFGYLNKLGLLESTRRYIAKTVADIAQGVREAQSCTDEILIGTGKGYEDGLSYNRRVFFKDGTLHMNWEILENDNITSDMLDRPEGPIDPDLYVIKICDAKGGLKAVIVNFTLHPAILVMQDWLFSKDYIWGMEKILKKELGEDVLVYFTNGAEGNINHINMWDRTQKRGWEEAERIGTVLGNEVLKITSGIKVYEVGCLKQLYRSVRIPAREISEAEINEARRIWTECGGVVPSLTDGVPPEWYAGNILKLAQDVEKSRDLELQVIKLGDAVIATLPGEVFVEFGLEIKKKSPYRNTILFGLTNQSIGYIPAKQAFKNGGYEPTTCEFSILAPEAGDIIVKELLDMIDML